MNPYSEKKINRSIVIRTFSADLDEMDLKWHWDNEDRVVEPLYENDWLFQFDNQLPIQINKTIYIPKGVIHRIIKGTADLTVRINKMHDLYVGHN